MLKTLNIMLMMGMLLAFGMLHAADAAAIDEAQLKEALTLPFVSAAAEAGALQTSAGELKPSSRDFKARDSDLSALKKALKSYQAAVKKSSLSALAQESVIAVIDQVSAADKGLATDQVNPAFARRLVLNNWLDVLSAEDASLKDGAEKLKSTLLDATALKPIAEWKRGTKRLELIGNVWGGVAWLLSNGSEQQLAMRPAVPMYDSSLPVNKVWVQLSLPKTADVYAVEGLKDATNIVVFAEGKELASWSADAGFKSDVKVWRSVYKSNNQSLVSNYFPPHIVHQQLDGSIYQIIVSSGVVHAAKDGSEAAAQAFLDEAATVMKDAAHLDLVGQYLLKYVYDSPETSVPYLVGNREVNGEIHQTAFETLSTVTGGVCRGDCDDLSELYQQITTQQGKLGHVVMLPGHAALAFAEKHDAEWAVTVLQTGPALEFRDAELPVALGKAYKHFGATETFDPNGLNLLLRFSNEKTRGPWRLGWRIFLDKTYAETMIDIQKDWHYQTYLQAIKKMQGILDAGDKDPANYREISSLYAFTAQWDKFIENHLAAVALTKDPVSILEFNRDYINTLFDAGRDEEALKVLTETKSMLANQELRKNLGDGIISYGLGLAGISASNNQPTEALQILDQTVSMSVLRVGAIINQMIEKGMHKQGDWNTDGQKLMLRRILRQYVGVSLTALSAIPANERPAQSAAQSISREWMQKIAFADAEGPSGMLSNYAIVASYCGLDIQLDALIEQLEKVELPIVEKNTDHKAIFNAETIDPQLPWIKASAPFWAQEILRAVSNKYEPLDKKRLKRLDAGLEVAMEFAIKNKMDSRSLQITGIQSGIAVAMVTQDEKRLRSLLGMVEKRNDKMLRDGVAALIGNMSRHVELEDYKKSIEIWIEVVHYKPKIYWIAWRAALSGSPKHAVAVAKRASELYKDDSSFVEEYNFMKELF